MIILWTILSIIGFIVAVWYFTSVFNPYGRINYPMLLWKSAGHLISWVLIIIGIISLIMLYYSGPRNLDSVISYTWDTKRGGPSGTNAQEVSAFI